MLRLGVAVLLALGASSSYAAQPATHAAVSCAGLPATIVGTAQADELQGTEGADVIAGLGGDDTIDGRGGDDVLCGDKGADLLHGGAGDDRVYGGRNGLRAVPDEPPDNVGDTLEGGPGDDLLDPGEDLDTDEGGGFAPETFTFERAAAGVEVDLIAGTATGEGQDTLVLPERGRFGAEVIGSPFADVLSGSPRADTLIGMAGDDVLLGRAGGDELLDFDGDDGVSGDDTLSGGSGHDYLVPGAGADTTLGGRGPDLIEDSHGAPHVRGGRGSDEISLVLLARDDASQAVEGGAGRNDHLLFSVTGRAAHGRVDLRGGRAVVRSTTGRGRASLHGIESVVMPNGRWRFRGSAADEAVFGGMTRTSRLVAHAGPGDDYLLGTPGDDRLLGGRGRDRADGQGGDDVCRVERASRCG